MVLLYRVDSSEPMETNKLRSQKQSLTLQEVQLTRRGVQAHEVEAAGRPAAPPLGRHCGFAGGQTLQHAALPGPVQSQDQNLAPPKVLLLLQAVHK